MASPSFARCCVLLAVLQGALASQFVYPAKFVAANSSIPSLELSERNIFARDSCGGNAPCGKTVSPEEAYGVADLARNRMLRRGKSVLWVWLLRA